MKNNYIHAQDGKCNSQKNIGLPLLALGFDFLPIFFIFIGSFLHGIQSLMLLFAILSPIAGMTTGIITLSSERSKIGIIGKIIAIVAIALPAMLLALIAIFFIGAVTGVISFM